MRKPRTRSTDVCNLLRGMIRSGELGMGQRLKQLHLAQQLNSSQTPVREAMRTLEQEGWLVSQFGRGMRVRKLTPKSIDELYETREVLEGFMARKAASTLDGAQIDQLRILARAADEAEGDDESGEENPSRHDIEFHLALAGMVGNEMVLEVYQRLCNLGLLLVALSKTELPLAATSPHMDLVEAIASHQPEWAEAVAKRLLRVARDRVIEAMKRGSEAYRVDAAGGKGKRARKDGAETRNGRR